MLKKYFGGASSCKICDKKHSSTTLRDSEKLSVENSVGKLSASEVNHTGVCETAFRYWNFGLRDGFEGGLKICAAIDDVRDVFPHKELSVASSNKFNCLEEQAASFTVNASQLARD